MSVFVETTRKQLTAFERNALMLKVRKTKAYREMMRFVKETSADNCNYANKYWCGGSNYFQIGLCRYGVTYLERGIKTSALTIQTITVTPTGCGIGTSLIEDIHQRNPFEHTVVQCVQPLLAEYLRKQRWTLTSTYIPDCFKRTLAGMVAK